MQELKKWVWLRRIMLILVILVFTSCLDYKAVNVYIFLDQNDFYRGTAKIEFIHIHSTAIEAKERRIEMSEFYTDYQKNAQSILEVLPLYNTTVKLTKKTPLSTDGYIEGEFKNILTVFAPLFQEGDFRFEGNARRLSVWWKNPLKEEDNVNLILIFSGKIISHNSNHFDLKSNSLKWSMHKDGDREIHFVLEAE